MRKRRTPVRFTDEETAQVCAAWAATPADGPRNGTDWETVAAYFNRNFKPSPSRNALQLRARFSTFYPVLLEWHRAMEEATQTHTNHPSVDITTLAQHIFSGTKVGEHISYYKRFNNIASYEAVSEGGKWMGYLQKKNKRKSRTVNTRAVSAKVRTPVATDDEDDIADIESDDNNTTISHNHRPTTNNDDVVNYQSQHESTEESMDLELRKLIAQEKATAHHELTTEIQIMMHDCGSGSKERRDAYFTIMQKRILDKRKRD